jgi:hypothetical protein
MRFIIAGTSKYIHRVPERFLDNASVIAVNCAPLIERVGRNLGWHLVWDTDDIQEVALLYEACRTPACRYLRLTENDYQFSFPGLKWYTERDIKMKRSICTAGADLARQLGATEIYLVGIDFLHDSPGWDAEHRRLCCEAANEFFRDFPIPVFKTVENSPLELEYRPCK